MGRITSHTWSSGAAAGGAGVATATAQSERPISGRVLAVGLVYQDSPPVTTDVTLRTKAAAGSDSGPQQNILVITNAATDDWWLPRKEIVAQDGTVIATPHEPIPVDDYLEVVIAQANNGDSVDVTVIYEE